MTKRELIQAIENQPVHDDEAIMVSIIRNVNDQYEAPVLAVIDYVSGTFINIHVD